LLGGAVAMSLKLTRMATVGLEACASDTEAAVTGGIHSPAVRRKRLPVRTRVMRAGMWLGVYLISVVLLSRSIGS
jgi:hypothetical protein